MKRILIVGGAAALFLVSCASLKPESDAVLAPLAAKYLDGPSQVDPLQLSAEPDFVAERVTLVRTIYTTTSNGTTNSHNAPDVPLGLSFGNGLYLDDDNNLVIRLDEMAGISPDWNGMTKCTLAAPEAQNVWTKTVTYSADGLDYSNSDAVLDKNYHINLKSKKISVALTPLSGFVVESQDGGKIKVYPQITLNPFDGTTYEKIDNGVKTSWWGSTLGVPTPLSDEIKLVGNKITDSDKYLEAENTGTYLRFAFSKGNTFSFRIYRTPTTYLVIDETNGDIMFLAKKTQNGWAWKTKLNGPLGLPSDKIADCEIALSPAH